MANGSLNLASNESLIKLAKKMRQNVPRHSTLGAVLALNKRSDKNEASDDSSHRG